LNFIQNRTNPVSHSFSYVSYYLFNPVRVFQTWHRSNLWLDLMAGVTVGLIALPQAVAFALIADLPPQMGLYATIVLDPAVCIYQQFPFWTHRASGIYVLEAKWL
jgi:hypothetical protein